MHNFVKVQINSNKIFLFVLLNYKFERNSTHIDNWSTNNLTFPKWGKGDRGAVDEDAKKTAYGSEGAKISRNGRFYSFQAAGRGAVCLKHKGEFRALRSSARALPLTHELLKKFDQNLNTIFPLSFFNKIENFRPIGAEINLSLVTSH